MASRVRAVFAMWGSHAQGILHRDVKPQNVLLDADGKAVLTDSGIAAVAGATLVCRRQRG
ncbi:hypothetical protein [Streptomyces sp. NPDC001678]|uniref:protein kinase domain-containing protein n=1 Tax=Streptomyces sp. NPDC001678 TaxID=3364599 RepID=UPI0036B30799